MIRCRVCHKMIKVPEGTDIEQTDAHGLSTLQNDVSAECQWRPIAYNNYVDHYGEVHEADQRSSLEKELTEWWLEKAKAEIVGTVPKSVEYGSYDMQLIGSVLADLIKWDTSKTERTEAVHVELGAFFYLLGKVGRMASALTRSELPSDDTYFDASVYSRMVQRAREAGGWPGVAKEDDVES